MRKLLFGITCSLIFLITACGGDKQQKVHSFVETFAGYVNAGQLDSIKVMYPEANFDSIVPLSTDSVKINETDGITRVDFGSGKWIEIQEGEDGNITIVNSKGIAAFPEDKMQLAVNTGMLNLEDTDVRTQELLNDTEYFAWLEKNFDHGDYVIQIKPGKYKNIWKPNWGEGSKGSITVTLTNLSDAPISGSDYFITYKTNESNGYTDDSRRNYTKNNKRKGIDLNPKESGTINLSEWETYKFYNFEIKPAEGKEQVLKYQFKPTGKEYQEYLDSKK